VNWPVIESMVLSMRNFVLTLLICCGLLLTTAVAAQEHNSEHHWDYGSTMGPSHWGELNPEFRTCSTGHLQSPIDIMNTKKVDLPEVVFDYKPSPLRIVNNGHTIMINYAPGSYLTVGDQRYQVKQFHFHRPSEEKIRGMGFDMSAHIVHDDGKGNLVVVAILLQAGEADALIQELWKHLPKESAKEEVLDGVQIDLSQIVPSNRSYYTFKGSLTTPPCSENVTWIVLKHPTTISPAEIDQFSHLYQNDARPTQPLYDRVILESK
jgi:carbonic anhydrase